MSIAERIILTTLLPFLEYSFRKIAVNTPIGTAITRLIPTVIRVVTIAGKIEMFLTDYLPNRSCVVKCGIPFTQTKRIIDISPIDAITAET